MCHSSLPCLVHVQEGEAEDPEETMSPEELAAFEAAEANMGKAMREPEPAPEPTEEELDAMMEAADAATRAGSTRALSGSADDANPAK